MRHLRSARVSLLALVLSVATCFGVAAGEFTGIPIVVDGDTIRFGDTRVRIYGIDAPESGQQCWVEDAPVNCGLRARSALEKFISDNYVRCYMIETDRYGRWIARCLKSDEDIGAWMVREGHAVAYQKYADDYVAEERKARQERLGLWEGEFVMPWDWRRGKRLDMSASRVNQDAGAAKPCSIKGNISGSGEKIYHTTASPWYAHTKINEGKGERWFCSEEEAVQAGWRAPNF